MEEVHRIGLVTFQKYASTIATIATLQAYGLQLVSQHTGDLYREEGVAVECRSVCAQKSVNWVFSCLLTPGFGRDVTNQPDCRCQVTGHCRCDGSNLSFR